MNYSKFDFNINNYSIDDIYNLFKLDIRKPICTPELKQAKTVVLRMHPDKSRLPKEYFLFFTKAYSLLLNISECNQHHRKQHIDAYRHDEYYNAEMHQYISSNRNDIMASFNSKFEAINSDISPDNQPGYGDWFKGKEDDSSKMQIEDHSTAFSSYKGRCKYATTDLSVVVPETASGNYSMLVDDNAEYSSDMFGTLRYTDLKKSYTNTLIDISDTDFKITDKPQTMDQLNKVREVTVSPIPISASKGVFDTRDKLENDISTHRAYALCKQLEQSQDKNARMTCDFYKIVLK
jgi:hypothetical protein